MSFNKITIVGNLGRDPELRYTPQGMAVCDFSMATSEKKRDKSGEMQDMTTWFRVTLWGKQAETASKYLTKGRQVYIEGRLRVEEWSDRDGKSRYSLEVNGTDIQFIGARGDDMSAGSAAAGGARSTTGGGGGMHETGFEEREALNTPTGNAPSDDDIPF